MENVFLPGPTRWRNIPIDECKHFQRIFISMIMAEVSCALRGFPAVPAADMVRKGVAGLVTHLEPAAFWLQRDPDKAQHIADILAAGDHR